MNVKSYIIGLLLTYVNVATGITLPELRAIISSDSQAISRAKIVTEVNLVDNSPILSVTPKNNHEDEELKIKRINSKQYYLSTYTIDIPRNLIKEVWVDLRDLDTIAKTENLTPIQKTNVNCSQSVLVDNTTLYEMSLLDSSRTGAEAQALLGKRPGPLSFDQLSLGVINEKFLKEEYLVKLTSLTKGDSEYLKIELAFAEHGDSKVEYICDPNLGYRFREQKWTFKGEVTKQIIADDYKMIDGIPFPFTCTTTFYSSGKVKKQITKKVKEVELNPVLTEKDFKLFLPKGTFIMEDILMKDSRTTESEGLMGIEDILQPQAAEEKKVNSKSPCQH